MRKTLIKYYTKITFSAILTSFIFISGICTAQTNDIKNVDCSSISALDTNNNRYLLKDIKSSYLVLYFWSCECSHCLQTQKSISSLSKIYPLKKLRIIAFNVDSLPVWKECVKKMAPPYLQLNDGCGLNSKTLDLLKITGTPTFVILNKRKKVVDVALTEEDLLKKVNNLW